jgi:hypothetical protein
LDYGIFNAGSKHACKGRQVPAHDWSSQPHPFLQCSHRLPRTAQRASKRLAPGHPCPACGTLCRRPRSHQPRHYWQTLRITKQHRRHPQPSYTSSAQFLPKQVLLIRSTIISGKAKGLVRHRSRPWSGVRCSSGTVTKFCQVYTSLSLKAMSPVFMNVCLRILGGTTTAAASLAASSEAPAPAPPGRRAGSGSITSFSCGGKQGRHSGRSCSGGRSVLFSLTASVRDCE